MQDFCFQARVFELADAPEPHALLARFAGRRPVLLDSAGGEPGDWSLLAFDPVLAIEHGAEWRGTGGWPQALRAALARLDARAGDAVPGPFAGGFLGALAYDLGAAGETLALPAEPWGQPLIAGGLYVDFVVRDERAQRSWLVLGESPGDARASVAERRAALLELLAAPAPPGELRARGALHRHTPPELHAARVEQARELIGAGEIYQANLAHRFTRELEGAPPALYARLRARNRAPYMGYLEHSGGALLSASPELLLECDGRSARTRPIKGTIAREADPEADARQRARLLASLKDLAELAMIVDLERNDLGRVARWGSVAVERFPRLASYARVHHLMADVSAELREGCTALDALCALFPGGSISGAPKLRALEAIAAIEGEGRGFFCGALGLLDTRGHALFNILIRTLLWRARPESGARVGEVSFRVGGGITWSSQAAAEDEETLAKAVSLAEALESEPRAR